jgi:hypothetical protein
MDRFFIANEDTKNKLVSLDKEFKSKFPRVNITHLNRRTVDEWSFIISGPDDDVIHFIDGLVERGIPLDA